MEINDEALLLDLECPVCKDYFYSQIRQCNKGHSICAKCCPRLKKCPVCKVAIDPTNNNYHLQMIILKLKLPCKYRTSGCQFMERILELKDHQEFCKYGKLLCPLSATSKCSWMGKLEDLLEHARAAHKSNVKTKRRIDLDLKKDTSIVDFLEAHSKTFKYTVCINVTTNTVKICVQLVGPRTDATKYSFIATLTDTWNCIIMAPCQPLVVQEINHNLTNSVYVDGLKELCVSDKGVDLQIEIVLTKDPFARKRVITDDENKEIDNSKRKNLKLSE